MRKLYFVCYVLVFAFTAFLLSPSAAYSQDVKGTADRAIQWLVGQQKEDGSFGNVEKTALVVYAMEVSPRMYREDDGPFMRRALDYLVSNIDKTTDAAALTAMEGAIKGLNSKKFEASLKQVQAQLANQKGSAVRNPLAAIEGAKFDEIFSSQLPNGSWNDSVEETALKVITISTKKPAAAPAPKLEESRAKGAKYLLSQRANNLWGIGGKPEAGITALVISAFLASGSKDAEIEKALDEGLKYLASLAKSDGSVYDKGFANYTTCISVMAFVDSGKPEFKPIIEKAQQYILSLQASEKTGYRPEEKFFGGIGYGDSQRTDLSNLQYAMETLSATGLPQDNMVYKKALVFLARTQNYSETNNYVVESNGVKYVSGNDGGAAYYPGNSPAGYDTLPDGSKVPRSYGGMTYALLRGYLFAGLPKEDPKLKAAVAWIQKNYTLQENPGFDKRESLNAGMQGYYYYLLTMAKALDALGQETITTPDGVAHKWREELKAKILSMQKPDGSWVNEYSQRWWEGNPVLATAYALATLKYVK